MTLDFIKNYRMRGILKAVTFFCTFNLIAAATGQANTDRYDGLWELIGNTDAYTLNDGAISCPPTKGRAPEPVIVEESVIRNAFSEAPVHIDADGKFKFITPSGMASAMGEFKSAQSGMFDMVLDYKIAGSTGAGCRLSYELKRSVQQELHLKKFSDKNTTNTADVVRMMKQNSRSRLNVLDIKKGQPSRVITLNLRPGSCENGIDAYAIGPKPKHGTVVINLLNPELCTFEVIYTPTKGFTGSDQVGVILPVEQGSPLRRILPFSLRVK